MGDNMQVCISGSSVDKSGSSINIDLKISSEFNTDKLIEAINTTLEKHGIKRKK